MIPDNETDETPRNFVLAEQVQRVLQERNWSLAQAEAATGLSKATICRMRQGFTMRPSTIQQWARSLGESEATWARYALAGHPLAQQTDDLSGLAQSVGNGARLLMAMEQVQPVTANLERMAHYDAPVYPLGMGGPVRVMEIRHDCMRPLLEPGDVVVVASPETVRDGDVVIAAVNIFSRTCKRIRLPAGLPSYLEPLAEERRIEERDFVVLGVVKYRLESMQERAKQLGS